MVVTTIGDTSFDKNCPITGLKDASARKIQEKKAVSTLQTTCPIKKEKSRIPAPSTFVNKDILISVFIHILTIPGE